MRPATAYKFGFALLLTASLAGKALTRQPPDPDRKLFVAAAGRTLTAAGFRTAVLAKPSGPYLFAARGRCHLLVAEQDALGTLADRNDQFARRIGPPHFVWRAQRYAAAPRTAAIARFLVWREQVRIGLSPARDPLAFVADNGACDIAPIDRMMPAALPR